MENHKIEFELILDEINKLNDFYECYNKINNFIKSNKIPLLECIIALRSKYLNNKNFKYKYILGSLIFNMADRIKNKLSVAKYMTDLQLNDNFPSESEKLRIKTMYDMMLIYFYDSGIKYGNNNALCLIMANICGEDTLRIKIIKNDTDDYIKINDRNFESKKLIN